MEQNHQSQSTHLKHILWASGDGIETVAANSDIPPHLPPLTERSVSRLHVTFPAISSTAASPPSYWGRKNNDALHFSAARPRRAQPNLSQREPRFRSNPTKYMSSAGASRWGFGEECWGVEQLWLRDLTGFCSWLREECWRHFWRGKKKSLWILRFRYLPLSFTFRVNPNYCF